MRILDRYIFRNVVVPLAYCLLAFGLLIVIHDLFDHFTDFLEADTPLRQVLAYYLFLMPSVIVLVVPVSLLLAVLYSLLHLTKNNELTAMRACGVSIYRIVSPVIGLSLAMTVLVATVHETLAPWSAYWTSQFLRLQKHKGDTSLHVASNLPYNNEVQDRLWMIEGFNTQTFDMTNVTVTQERPDGTALSKIHAAQAKWLDGRWWFMDAAVQQYDQAGNPVRLFDESGKPIGSTRFERQLEMTELTETPQDFLNETKDPEFLSSAELLKFIQTHQHLSRDTIARVRVDFHNRLAMPWMCLIVTLLGIPFGSQTARKGTFMGVALSIGLFFGFYFLINLCLWMGKELILPAWLAGWMPNLLFLSIGCVLLYRMR